MSVLSLDGFNPFKISLIKVKNEMGNPIFWGRLGIQLYTNSMSQTAYDQGVQDPHKGVHILVDYLQVDHRAWFDKPYDGMQ